MIVHGSIPDEVWVKFLEDEGQPKQPLKALADRLRHFEGLKRGSRRLVLEGEDLKKIEGLIGKPLETVAQLALLLKTQGEASLEGVKVALRDGQRKYIQGRATHYKVPFETQAAKDLVEALDRALGNY